MQRIVTILAVCTPAAVAAQGTAAAQLWRLAAATVAVPPALVTGGGGAIWNPAQPPPTGRASGCVEIIQTPAAVGATGVLLSGRLRVPSLGALGVLYGGMGISDLLRTTLSPTGDSGSIPYYARFVAATWAATRGGTTLGAALGFHDARLDQTHAARAAVNLGVAQWLPGAIRIAAAARLLAPLPAGDPHHGLYGGVERRMWRGTLWSGSGSGSLFARYGIALGAGFKADHHVGMGLAIADQVLADVQLIREGSYGAAAWRGSAGVRIRIGHYRLSYARDTGISDIGSAYRVGLEASAR